jgi:nickel-dependent lactate racemase
MSATLRYGANSKLKIDFAPGVLIGDFTGPHGNAIVDLAGEVTAMLGEPIAFPPLAAAMVPGDRVALALEPAVPQASTIVAALVKYLCDAGSAPGGVTILRTKLDEEAGAEDPRSQLPAELRELVTLETHDPDRREQLAYLAATPKKGRPIYLNRALCDADVVISVGCLRCEQAIEYFGVYGGLYPTFSDTHTLQRFRNPELVDSHADIHVRANHEVESVGWLTGTPFTVQVIPGPDESILEVLAGEAEAVFRTGQEICQEAWSHTVPQRASLVVAGISGGPAQQTWDNVGRALAAALRVVADDGAIALCTNLTAEPGPAVQNLLHTENRRRAMRWINKERPADTASAVELAEAMGRAKVYLLSQLDASTVEDTGIAPVSDPDDIVRLAHRHSSCILLADAQYAVANALED